MAIVIFIFYWVVRRRNGAETEGKLILKYSLGRFFFNVFLKQLKNESAWTINMVLI